MSKTNRPGTRTHLERTRNPSPQLLVDCAVDIARQLLDEHSQTAARQQTLRRDLARIIESSQSVSTDDEHDPEGSTIAFERAQVAALLDQATAHLTELDQAAQRLDAGTYGRCEACGAAIAPERLLARPTAARCIGCAGGAQAPRSDDYRPNG